MGIAQSYILQDRGTIMIGDGSPKKIQKFKKCLQKNSIEPEEIQLIILTHGHFDHTGAAKELKELTGAKIAIHHRDKDLLETGTKVMPPGVTVWGSALHSVLKTFWLPFFQLTRTQTDIILGDEGMSLSEYGVEGKILHTPGHTPGSVSIVLESGEAFVGDLAVNMFPLSRKPRLAIFAEDLAQLKISWNVLLKQDIKTVYPAHGKPFSVDKIREQLVGIK